MTTITPITPFIIKNRLYAPQKQVTKPVTAPVQNAQNKDIFSKIPYYPPFGSSGYSDFDKKTTTERIMSWLSDKTPEAALEIIMDNPEEIIVPNYFSSLKKGSLISLIADNISSQRENNTFVNDNLCVAGIITGHTDFDPYAKLKFYNERTGEKEITLVEYLVKEDQHEILSTILDDKRFEHDTNLLTDIVTYYSSTTQSKDLKTLNILKNFLSAQEENSPIVEVKEDTIPIIKDELASYRVDAASICPKGLGNIGGMEEAKALVREFIMLPWSEKYREKLKANEVKMPNGFLMYGPPGCGKTFIASAIATEMDIPMYEVSLSDMGGKFAYETERELGRIFSTLKKAYQQTGKPNLLLLDEIDAVCGRRDGMQTDWLKIQTGTLLKLINNASDNGIILIGATNLLENVDPAALRTGRFDKKIEIKKPDEKERAAIFRTLAQNKPMLQDFESLIPMLVSRTENYTCSDVNAIFQQAMRTAIFSDKEVVTRADFEDAIEKIGSSIAIAKNAEKGNLYNRNTIGFNPTNK